MVRPAVEEEWRALHKRLGEPDEDATRSKSSRVLLILGDCRCGRPLGGTCMDVEPVILQILAGDQRIISWGESRPERC
jgi:hypothetical protein